MTRRGLAMGDAYCLLGGEPYFGGCGLDDESAPLVVGVSPVATGGVTGQFAPEHQLLFTQEQP